MKVGLIDYGMGNLLSVSKALEHLEAQVETVTTPESMGENDALVLPGVGNFGDGMRRLDEMELTEQIKNLVATGHPFLGICLGMQLLMERSEEAPGLPGLGLFKGEVKRFDNAIGLKIPHMGWNTVEPTENGGKWFDSPPRFFYFVHSFHVVTENPETTAGTTDYGGQFASAIARGNILATQFHPEKSQDDGLALLRKFLENARKASSF